MLALAKRIEHQNNPRKHSKGRLAAALSFVALACGIAAGQVSVYPPPPNGATSCSAASANWLACTISGSTLTLGAATGQASHQVIGTCGSATSFGPCTLGTADLPSSVLLSGGALGTPSSGTLTNATGYPLSALAAPASNASFTFPTSTTANLTLTGTAPGSAPTGTNQGDILDLTSGAGGACTGAACTGGTAGGSTVVLGAGGSSSPSSGAGAGGVGGLFSLTAGIGGTATGTSGNPGSGGAGGAITIAAGTGGAGTANNSNGGVGGAANGSGTAGTLGAVTIQQGGNTVAVWGAAGAMAINSGQYAHSSTLIGGKDISANGVIGNLIARGGNQTGTGGATSAAGGVLVEGGTNAGTNAASQGGSVEILSGASTAAITGLQGLSLYATNYNKGATVTQWNLECESASMTVADCGASAVNWVGIAELVNTNSVQIAIAGQVPINASAAVTLGHTVCVGATAGKVTDSGGTGACAAGLTAGVVMANQRNVDVAGRYRLCRQRNTAVGAVDAFLVY